MDNNNRKYRQPITRASASLGQEQSKIVPKKNNEREKKRRPEDNWKEGRQFIVLRQRMKMIGNKDDACIKEKKK